MLIGSWNILLKADGPENITSFVEAITVATDNKIRGAGHYQLQSMKLDLRLCQSMFDSSWQNADSMKQYSQASEKSKDKDRLRLNLNFYFKTKWKIWVLYTGNGTLCDLTWYWLISKQINKLSLWRRDHSWKKWYDHCSRI